MRSTADAPSVTGEALPAVMVPSAPNAGLRVASRSSEVSGRGPVSCAMPSSGTISCARRSRAATALRWLARATSSCRARGMFHLARVISMCSPIERPVVGSRNVAGSAPLSHSTPPGDPGADPPPSDGVRDDRRRPEAGDAVGRNRLRLDPGRQAGLEHDLPGEVGLAVLRHDHAERHRVDAGGIDLVSLQQAAHRVLRQGERAEWSRMPGPP